MTCASRLLYIFVLQTCMYSTYHAPGAVSNVMLLILPATHTSSRKCKGVHYYYSWNASLHKCNIKMMYVYSVRSATHVHTIKRTQFWSYICIIYNFIQLYCIAHVLCLSGTIWLYILYTIIINSVLMTNIVNLLTTYCYNAKAIVMLCLMGPYSRVLEESNWDCT